MGALLSYSAWGRGIANMVTLCESSIGAFYDKANGETL